MTPMTTSMASQRGSPLRSSQNRGGALMIAMKIESRNGTTMASAARIPATTTTNARRGEQHPHRVRDPRHLGHAVPLSLA